MKLLSASMLFSLLSWPLFGQEVEGPSKVHVGFKAGFTISNVTGSYVQLMDNVGYGILPHKDFTFGFILTDDLNRYIRWKVEANSLVKGGDYEGSVKGEPAKVVPYLQIPALLGFKLPIQSPYKIIFEGGYSSNFALKSIEKTLKTDSDTPKLMLSPAVGVEIGYPFNKNYLFFNYRYDIDNQRYFQRADGKYFLDHDGGHAITFGLLFGKNKPKEF